jgi:hypothetical protein
LAREAPPHPPQREKNQKRKKKKKKGKRKLWKESGQEEISTSPNAHRVVLSVDKISRSGQIPHPQMLTCRVMNGQNSR